MRNTTGLVSIGFVAALLLSACGGSDTGSEQAQGAAPRESVAEQQAPLVEWIDAPPGDGFVSTLAGKGPPNLPGAVDNADAKLGTFNDPAGIAVGHTNPTGIAYVADWGNNSIRAINPNGSLTTVITGRPNLLVNPRAEDTSAPVGINGWTISTGNWYPIQRGSSCNNTICGHPYDGIFWFFGGAGDAEIYQDVAITRVATQKYHFSAVLRGNSSDQARVRIEYLSGRKGRISTGYDSGLVNPSVWTVKTDERLTPVGTAYIRVILTTHATSGTVANAYFDAVELRAMRPSDATAADTDQDLFAPAAVGVLSNGNLLVGGSGLWTANPTTKVATKATSNFGYVAPRRVSSISVVEGTDWAYIADPTDPYLHVRTSSGFGYKAYVEAGPNSEPLAVAARSFDAGNDLVWVSYRGLNRLYIYKCGRPTGLTGDSTTIVSCVFQNQQLGSTSNGATDDIDGTAGGERFRQGIYGLATGAFNDLLIAETYNETIRRNFGAYTRTFAGGNYGYQDGGPGGAAFTGPTGIAYLNGDILVADRTNNVIRKVGCGAANLCAGNGTCSSYPVDDHVECSTDTCEVLAIRHTPKATGASCADGNACNGAETCNASGVCVAGTPPVVDDNKTCNVDSCDPTGGVMHTLLAAGTPCATGVLCAPLSACTGTSDVCPAGPALAVDDYNDCTVDACGGTGVTHTPKAAGTACKVSNLSTSSDGTCDSTANCNAPTTVINAGTHDRTLPTPPSSLFDDYLGSGGIQTGSTACVYDAAHPTCAFIPTHMALVRGTVADASGAGLQGATISVLNHPEFGTTVSQANGEYFLVVNGGGPLTIRAGKTGLLSSDRVVNPPWGGTDFAQDIVLIALDSQVTPVTFSAGGLVSGTFTFQNQDGDATPARNAYVYFPANVGATSNGAALPATAKFRVTEYTVGSRGPNRMPANVAANTMYTYAAEFTLEDAGGNVYDNVTFATPVMSYVHNFLNLAVSETVPVGYYDRQAGNWQPMPNGRVIAIDNAGAVTGLQAGDPAVSAGELAALAAFKGMTIWRLPLKHFSPLDFNMGIGAPECETQNGTAVCPGAVEAHAKGGDDGPACGSCQKTGSIIDVERQVLRETFPVVGTPFSLNYSSENTLGYAANKILDINFENHPKHSKMKSYVIDFKVAGKRVVNGGLFKDANGNWPKGYQAVWDGRDQDGRAVQGQVTATLAVGANYGAVPTRVVTFGASSSSGGIPMTTVSLTGTRQDPNIIFWKHHHKQLQVWDASALGFGGWTINAHHAYDPVGNVIYQGDGTHRKVDTTGGGVVSLVAGGVVAPGASPDGTAAASAAFRNIQSLAVGRDGEVFAAIPVSHVVRKIGVANGQYSTVRDYAGKSELAPATLPSGPVAAVSANLKNPVSIALHDDGRLAVADYDAHRVYEVSADGATLRPIAGTGDGSVCSSTASHVLTPWVDGTLAKDVPLCNVQAVATGPDGSTYFVNSNWVGTRSYAARIDPAGGLWHIAGSLDTAVVPPFRYAQLAAGTTGRQIALVAAGIAVDRNNTVFLSVGYEVIAVPASGPIRVYSLPDSARAHVNSNLGVVDFALFSDGAFLRPGDNHTLNRCTAAGCAVVGGTANSWSTDTVLDAPAVGNKVMTGGEDFGAAVGPDGSIFLGQTQVNGMGGRIVRIAAPVVAPGGAASCVYKVPSASGDEYYCFDARGQHKSTVNTLTNGTIRTFGYDASGLLTTITEGATANPDRTTTIDRATPGVVKIISPTSQSTQITLDATKKQYATSIAGAGTIAPTHDLNNGLLTGLTDVNNQPHAFNYDNYGRLQKDTDGANGFTRLARTDTATGKYTVAATTAMGKTDWFSREILANGNEQRVFGLLNGLTSTTVRDGAGTNTITLADGTTLSQTPGPGPVWGMLAPFVKSTTFTAGSNSISSSRTLTVNGGIRTDQTKFVGATTRTYEQVYSTANKTITLKSPAGRQIVYTLDGEGRVASIQPPGTPQIDLSFNATTGRLEKVKQGTGRVVDLTYSSTGTNKGFHTGISDPYVSPGTPSLSTTFAPDANGRPLSSTRLGYLTQFAWFDDGQLKSVTPPGKTAHQLGYDARGILKTYTPPTLGGTDEKTNFGVDLDRFLQSIDAPGWDDLRVLTDPIKGRTTSILVDGKSINFAYYGAVGDASCTTGCAPGHLSSITDNRSGSAIATTFGWQKSLPVSISHGGGTTTWAYDNDIRRTSEAFSKSGHSTSTVAFGYDADGLLTCASLGTCASGQTEKLAIARDPASGRMTGITLGSGPTETWAYNSYGELQSQDSTPFRIDYEHVDPNPALSVLRDTFGRVKRRKERVGVGAATRTFNYTYDELGRLANVDGAVTSQYLYDSNGNRMFARNSAGVVDGQNGNITYNAQDQLTKYGPTSFEYTLKGDLYRRVGPEGTTTYDYDALGALRFVNLPDGRVIEYLVDGLGRRVGKKVNGIVTKQWFYGAGMAPLAEADGTGTIRMRFVYASKGSVPDVIKTYTAAGVADKLYRVVSDQLGTPRVLLDSAGVIVKAMEFDEFGIKMSDTNSAVEIPFGFAGGLYDADTKLTRFGARDYDASIGRWVNKDPLLVFGGVNLYRYANNDPINLVDRTGRFPVVPKVALGAMVGWTYGAVHAALTIPTNLCWGDAVRAIVAEAAVGAASGAAGELVEGGFLVQFMWNTAISASAQGYEAALSGQKAPGLNELLARSVISGFLSALGSGVVTGLGGSESTEVIVEGLLVGGLASDAGAWAVEKLAEPGYFE